MLVERFRSEAALDPCERRLAGFLRGVEQEADGIIHSGDGIIQRPGGGVLPEGEFLASDDVAPGEHQVISFAFRRLGLDTFDPTPLTFVRAQATAAVPSVTFANGLALAYQ